jgi:hypothetical protein
MSQPQTLVAALDTMLANTEMPYEAAPVVALAYTTAKRIDEWDDRDADAYSPLANSMLKQIEALRQWVKPPDVVQEDPFDALARALSAGPASGAPDVP